MGLAVPMPLLVAASQWKVGDEPLTGETGAAPFVAAMRSLRAAPGGEGATLRDVVDAVCTGTALDAAVAALRSASGGRAEGPS